LSEVEKLKEYISGGIKAEEASFSDEESPRDSSVAVPIIIDREDLEFEK
jgi:hypothetical protein